MEMSKNRTPPRTVREQRPLLSSSPVEPAYSSSQSSSAASWIHPCPRNFALAVRRRWRDLALVAVSRNQPREKILVVAFLEYQLRGRDSELERHRNRQRKRRLTAIDAF